VPTLTEQLFVPFQKLTGSGELTLLNAVSDLDVAVATDIT